MGFRKGKKKSIHTVFAEAGLFIALLLAGMIFAAKSLLDTNLATREEKKAALKGTFAAYGYVKIEEAIRNAAKFFREKFADSSKRIRWILSHRFKELMQLRRSWGQANLWMNHLTDMIYQKLANQYPRAVNTSMTFPRRKRSGLC